MPTENRRVAAYLPRHIDDRLESFKVERGLKGDSPALITILEEFFGVSQQVAHAGSTPLGQRVDALESKVEDLVSVLTQRLQELSEAMESTQGEGEPLHRLEEDSLGELRSELMNTLSLSNAQLKSEILSELKSELPKSEQSFSPGQLSLSEPESELSGELPANTLSESNGELLGGESSDQVSDRDSSSGELVSELNSKLLPLTEEELAGRWNLKNPGSIRNKRSNSRHSPQDFIDWSTEKDPENVAWSYHKETKLYHPTLPPPEPEPEDF
jgi:hypothetical protein